MSIDTKILDGEGTENAAAVVQRNYTPQGLFVYTRPLELAIGKTTAMVNPLYGADFNINAGFTGTPEAIHDGTDSVLWAATALSGSWTFDSTAEAYTGAKSIDGTSTLNNSEAQFERASSISLLNYVALTGAIKLTGWTASGIKELEIRVRLAGVDTGVTVNLSEYIDVTTIGSWQTFVIPAEDLDVNGNSIDQLVVKVVDEGAGATPDFYLDVLQFEETSGAIKFAINYDKKTTYAINNLSISLAGPLDTTLLNASHPNLEYNKLVGTTLLNGIRLRLVTGGVVRFNSIFRDHMDFMSFPGMKVQSGGDGTNAWVVYTLSFTPAITLDSNTKDTFELIVSDNLSTLLRARLLVRGGEISTQEK